VSKRDDVLAALRTARGPVSAQELHAGMRSAGTRIGLATVYRTLAVLEAEGLVDALRPTGGELRYRCCQSTGHHHHLICRHCGDTVELDADVVEAWIRDLAAAHGFRELRHVVELTGVCPDCATGRGSRSPA
jgi:Fur family ferric uptake transcriptional regulator